MQQAYNNPRARPPIIIVMGVSGSGKSTVAGLLAARLGCPMLEGDSLHPPGNIQKMAAGTPLTDSDRAGWLAAIAQRIAAAARDRRALVVSCSALKRSYRDILRRGDPNLVLVYLAGSSQLIQQRMKARQHFMPPTLLGSQFQTLEAPGADEHPILCDVALEPPQIVAAIATQLAGEQSADAPLRPAVLPPAT